MNKLPDILDRMVSSVTVVTTTVRGDPFGMTASWVARTSNRPVMVSVSIAHKNFTHDKLKENNFFGLNIINSNSKQTALNFGTRSGKYANKFEGVEFAFSSYGNPILINGIVAFLDCRIVNSLKAGDHTLFLAEVLDGLLGTDRDPMVYYCKQFMGIEGGRS